MTYGKLKTLTSALLIGDNIFPKDDNLARALLEYAFSTVANKAEALHLFVKNDNEEILRFASGDYKIREPEMPLNDNSELDIDNELCFALARYMAASISKEKVALHTQFAEEIVRTYNEKVYQVLQSLTKPEEEQ
jgi:hypothetical protein